MSRYEYKQGRFYKDGQPFFLIAADYPYFRDRRDHWRDRLEKQQAAGVNCITFYIPWRHHLQFEGGRRWYDFTGQTKDSRDLAHYLELIKSLGLLTIIKPGPFIHSELNIGGLPDLVSPSFNRAAAPALRHHGKPAHWTYDASILPAPLEPEFDDLVREWLEAVRPVIAPYAGSAGPLVALQMNDETVYCTSNDPPWQIGFEPSGVRYYQKLCAERYGDIETYNRLHGTSCPSFDLVQPPRLPSLSASAPGQPASSGPQRREDVLQWMDWAEYQWKYRRDLYLRYAGYLDIDLPLLTNYAGITPPIEENVPNLQEHAKEPVPADFAPLYSEWWFGMNRVDVDAALCHYGMISWLGVAAYDRDVFNRYINTARRARGINMEENWGFGTLYDARSRDPVVPFFQTLASVAGGATGYVIFTMVNTGYWDDTLDRITKLQCPTFPSHAPIDEHGVCRPMYDTAAMLNGWFAKHGDAFLRCDLEIDSAYLLYAPYAAVSSWTPDERYWRVAGAGIPRCGHQGCEEFSASLQAAGYSFGMFELEAASAEQLRAPRSLALHSAFFMDAASQGKLAEFVRAGGRLLISGDLPEVDDRLQPCTTLRDAVRSAEGAGSVVYRSENLFADGRFAERLSAAGVAPHVSYSHDMRAYVYRGGEEFFVFFFNFDVSGTHDKFVEFYGQRLELRVGSKTSGVVRVSGGRIAGHLVKGTNEVEGITDRVWLRLRGQTIEGEGDFSG